MPNLDPTEWILNALRQFGLQQQPTKRMRRHVPYEYQLLAIAASRVVNYGKISKKRWG